MDVLTLFGVVTLTAMLVFYACEDRAPAFTLWFAGACLASSTYGFLQGAWPFGVVEAIWTGVAVQRWRARTVRRAVRATADGGPLACDVSEFASEERGRYHALRAKVTAAIREVAETPIGFRARLDVSVPLSEVAEWMSLEQRCCRFLNLGLRLAHDQTHWLELDGGPDVKRILRAEFTELGSAPAHPAR